MAKEHRNQKTGKVLYGKYIQSHNRVKRPVRPIHLKRCQVLKYLFTHFTKQFVKVDWLENNFSSWVQSPFFNNAFYSCKIRFLIFTFVRGLIFSRAFCLTAVKKLIGSLYACVVKTLQADCWVSFNRNFWYKLTVLFFKVAKHCWLAFWLQMEQIVAASQSTFLMFASSFLSLVVKEYTYLTEVFEHLFLDWRHQAD